MVTGTSSLDISSLKIALTTASQATAVLDNIDFNTVVATTPKPSSLALLGTGIVGIVGLVRRRLA